MIEELLSATHVGHGRSETRTLIASTAFIVYTALPGLQQVLRLERTVITKRTGRQRQETVYGITSLPPSAGRCAAPARRHARPLARRSRSMDPGCEP